MNLINQIDFLVETEDIGGCCELGNQISKKNVVTVSLTKFHSLFFISESEKREGGLLKIFGVDPGRGSFFLFSLMFFLFFLFLQ
jgi:hypothetical protein